MAHFARLSGALGHTFGDTRLLATALTHRSFTATHNERLEFLGDSVLNCAVSAALYARYPDLPEGDLSRLRANLVRQDSLAEIARELQLGALLRLGEGELKSGGRERASILADAVEALLGAIFLDAGFVAAAACVERLYGLRLDGLTAGQGAKDAKTRLQEWLQGKKRPLPRYTLAATSGAAHVQQFLVLCEAEGLPAPTTGEGGSRRLAEQAAAQAAFDFLTAGGRA